MAFPADVLLAGSGDLGSVTNPQWITGDMNIVTGPATIAAGQILDARTVMARSVAGPLVPLDTTQTDGRQNAVAILIHAVNTTAAAGNSPTGVPVPLGNGAADTTTEAYFGGCFNPDLAIWPAALTTTIQRVRQFDRTNIRFQRPL